MSAIAERVLAARDKALLRKKEFEAAEQAYFAACNEATFTDRDGGEKTMFTFCRDEQHSVVWVYTEEYKRAAPLETRNPIESHPDFLAWREAYAAKIKARNRYKAAMRKLMTIGDRNGK